MSRPAPLSSAEVETIYAAYEQVLGWEAKSIEGKRGIVTPIYEAVVKARVQTAQMTALRDQVDPRTDEDIDAMLDDVLRSTEEARRDERENVRAVFGGSTVDSIGAQVTTIRRYLTGDITERQACNWFDVDRLAFRTALAELRLLFAVDLTELVEALQPLSDAATPGEWRAVGGPQEGVDYVRVGDDVLTGPLRRANAAFLVAAVNYVRALLRAEGSVNSAARPLPPSGGPSLAAHPLDRTAEEEGNG